MLIPGSRWVGPSIAANHDTREQLDSAIKHRFKSEQIKHKAGFGIKKHTHSSVNYDRSKSKR